MMNRKKLSTNGIIIIIIISSVFIGFVFCFFRSESKEKIQFSFEYVIDCLCLCLCLTGDAAVPAVMIAQRAALITFAVSTSAKCYRLHLKYRFFPSFLP
jgi:hypothetical protein